MTRLASGFPRDPVPCLIRTACPGKLPVESTAKAKLGLSQKAILPSIQDRNSLGGSPSPCTVLTGLLCLAVPAVPAPVYRGTQLVRLLCPEQAKRREDCLPHRTSKKGQRDSRLSCENGSEENPQPDAGSHLGLRGANQDLGGGAPFALLLLCVHLSVSLSHTLCCLYAGFRTLTLPPGLQG